MSTKIYSAYKVNGLTMPEVMSYLKKVKASYLDKAHEFLMNCDKDKIKENYGSNFLTFQDTLTEHSKKLQNSVFNWTASAMVYFHQDNIYIQFFGFSFRLEPDVEGIFDGHLEDYHYQNQSDPYWCYEDEDYTDEQIAEFEADYETRERVWNEIFKDSYTPSKCGLIYEIYSEDDTFDVSLRYFKAIGEGNGW